MLSKWIPKQSVRGLIAMLVVATTCGMVAVRQEPPDAWWGLVAVVLWWYFPRPTQ